TSTTPCPDAAVSASATGISAGSCNTGRTNSAKATPAGQLRRSSAANSLAAPATTNQPVITHTPSRNHRSGLAVASPSNAQISNPRATIPAPTTAALVPQERRPDSAHTPARSILPPSSGRPGNTLNTPTAALAMPHSSTNNHTGPPAGIARSNSPNNAA